MMSTKICNKILLYAWAVLIALPFIVFGNWLDRYRLAHHHQPEIIQWHDNYGHYWRGPVNPVLAWQVPVLTTQGFVLQWHFGTNGLKSSRYYDEFLIDGVYGFGSMN